jgi:DNA-binding transcriptional regulator YhcF (GntR family)
MNLKPRQAAHRQIADSLRGKITLGEILPGTQLPSTQELAKTWGSHVATVHMGLTQLVSEGLLERTKKGTFVRNIGNRMSTVGVYFCSNIWDMDSKELEYTRQVYRFFKEILCENRIVEQVFMDKRSSDEQKSKWPVLEKAVNEHAIQGLVVLSMDCKHEGWLPKMNVPTTGMSGTISCNVANDMEQFIELGVQSLIQKGCRSIGLLSPTKKCVRKFYDHFQSVVRNTGAENREEWFSAPAERVKDQERYG